MSPVGVSPWLPPLSAWHAWYIRSMNPPVVSSQPSPTHEAWLLVADVRPSTLPAEYPNASCGEGPPGAAGMTNGMEYVKSPLESPALQPPDGARLVAP